MTAAVLLMRRHGPNCPAGHPQDSYSTEAEERRKNAKRCRCRIYASGTLAGVYYKLATRAREWERAREVLEPYLKADSWDLTGHEPPPPASPPPHAPSPGGGAAAPGAEGKLTPIGDAIKACLAEHRAANSAANTIRKYRYLLGRLERFSAHLGLRYVEEWTPATVRQFRDSWEKMAPRTKSKQLGLVKAFFEIFVEDKTLDFNPARIKDRRNRALRTGASDAPQKNPFTDEELNRMLEGCRVLGRTELRLWPKKRDGREVVAITVYREYHRKWTGEDLADFIQISYYTGLRISDVATFHVSRLTPSGEVKLRTTKNGNWVTVWIPEWLRARIEARAARIGPFIFGEHTTTNINVITDVWRRKLNALWDKTGPWESKPTPHRFRHTFVRMLLEQDVSPSLIAEMIGDTEEMIRRHYSAWMPGRQENARRILQQAFRNAPRFHAG